MRSEEKKKKILDSAMDLFIARGYENISVDDICRKNSISKPTFYKYVSSKEQILAHFFDTAQENAVELARNYLSENRPGAAVQALLGCLNDAADAIGPDLYSIYWSYLLRKKNKVNCRSSELKHLTIEAISLLQQTGQIRSKEHPEKLAFVLLDLSEGLGMTWAATRGGFNLVKDYQRYVFSVLGVAVSPEQARIASFTQAEAPA